MDMPDKAVLKKSAAHAGAAQWRTCMPQDSITLYFESVHAFAQLALSAPSTLGLSARILT